MDLPDLGAITPVHGSPSGWYYKREDLAGFTSDDRPSGAKVRQYAAMIEAAPPDAVLVVGCSADSAMQVYLADAGLAYDRPAIVVTAHRTTNSESTEWALDHGAKVVTTKPGYPSQYRKAARTIGEECGRPVVRWDRTLAMLDTAAQTLGTVWPDDVRRILVPTGSGLTAAGILAGLHLAGRADVEVVAAQVSPMAKADGIRALTTKAGVDASDVPLTMLPPSSPYGRRHRHRYMLPDGLTLDPYYAAKTADHLAPGDVLWVSGRRPF